MKSRKPVYRRHTLKTSLITFLLISFALFGIYLINPTPLIDIGTASPATIMYVDPASKVDPSLTPGSSFTVKAMVSDVEDLSNWQVMMIFDGSVVEATDITKGDFLAGQPEGTQWMEKIATSYCMFGESTKGKNETTGEPYPGVTGSGWLGSVEFQVKATGATVLNITNPPYTYLQKWSDSPPYKVVEIPFEMEDGYFSNVAVSQWTLSVDSDPISGVDFTLDGAPHTTPWSDLLDEGSYTVVMPSTWTVGPDEYVFDQWEDTSTDPTRTVSLTENTTITAYYVLAEKYWTLSVDSDPISGVGFTIDGATHTTPWSDGLAEGSYTIVMPSTWGIYDFDQWEDASTDPSRTISLTENTTVTAYYVARQWTLSVQSDPISGIDFTVDGVTHATPWSDLLDEGSYIIVMPSTWTVGPDEYVFNHWEDASPNPTRTVMLTSNIAVTAYYTLAPVAETVVAVDPPTSTANPGEYFTINITIANVTDLYSWAFKLKWQPGLLGCDKKDIIEGVFLEQGGTTVFTKKAYLSYIDVGCMLLMASEGVDGSGTLATVTFEVLKTGNCTLELYDVALLDSDLPPGEILHAVEHGYFYTTHPVASYMYSPHPTEEYGRPIVGETVTFNATTSYDPDQSYRGQTGIGIALYEWDFDGDGTYDYSNTDPYATHVYGTAGEYRVTLRVTDDDGETSTIDEPIIGTQIRVMLHDIAVINVTVTPTVFLPGATVSINVTVLNKGSVTEYLNVTVYKDSDPVKTARFPTSLLPEENGTTTIEWETTGITQGTYTIKVYAFLIDPATLESVPGIEREEVLPDNWMTYGTITVVGPDFELTASPASLCIQQGDSDTSTITVTSLNGFSDLVSLSVAGVPSDVTVTLDPEQVTPPADEAANSTLTVSVGLATTPGSYTLTITATSGTLEHSVDITLEIIELPPTQHQLTVNSDPITGVEFTLDGATHTTPWSDILDEGSYTVVMPSTWTVGANVYDFDHWEDASTDPSRTISLTTDMNVNAYYVYVPETHTLTVDSDPITGVEFTIDGTPHTTLWSDILPEHSYTIVMPSAWTVGEDVYSFDHWEDMSTNPSRTISLASDMTVTAYYVLLPPGEDVTPPIITINEPLAKDYLHSETITFDFNAVDTESGVAWISATLNGMTVESSESIELFTLSLGGHTLTVATADNAGNSATETVEFNVIATIDSMTNLVEKFYDLGYIDEQDVELALLNKLYAAEKKIEAGKTKVAKNILNAFINQLKAQSGKHVTVEAADILITDVQYVIDNL